MPVTTSHIQKTRLADIAEIDLHKMMDIVQNIVQKKIQFGTKGNASEFQ